MESDIDVMNFAKRFIAGKINWRHTPRDGIINFGNIISICIYRDIPFQVELFIVPFAPSSFTEHIHPDVDVVEYALAGYNNLYINDNLAFTKLNGMKWLSGTEETSLIRIHPWDKHKGTANMPYAFLSIQKWLHGVTPTSVGLNWSGTPASREQAKMLGEDAVDLYNIENYDNITGQHVR